MNDETPEWDSIALDESDRLTINGLVTMLQNTEHNLKLLLIEETKLRDAISECRGVIVGIKQSLEMFRSSMELKYSVDLQSGDFEISLEDWTLRRTENAT